MCGFVFILPGGGASEVAEREGGREGLRGGSYRAGQRIQEHGEVLCFSAYEWWVWSPLLSTTTTADTTNP